MEQIAPWRHGVFCFALTFHINYAYILIMNHPENMPFNPNLMRPISEAEIMKQKYELEAEDMIAQQALEYEEMNSDREALKYIADLLIGNKPDEADDEHKQN